MIRKKAKGISILPHHTEFHHENQLPILFLPILESADIHLSLHTYPFFPKLQISTILIFTTYEKVLLTDVLTLIDICLVTLAL